MGNGDLFQLLKNQSNSKGLTNGQTKKIFRQLLLGLWQMKERSICHLDLSIENVMFDTNDDAIIIDFGMCHCVEEKEKEKVEDINMKMTGRPPLYSPSTITNSHYSRLGEQTQSQSQQPKSEFQSPLCRKKKKENAFYPYRIYKQTQSYRSSYNTHLDNANKHFDVERNYKLIGPTRKRGKGSYMCPQVAREQAIDGFAADMWSMGVILFVMCTCTPLYGQPEDAAFQTIMTKGVEALLDHYENFDLKLNSHVRDLVIKLVNPNQDQRITLEEALLHPWLWTDDFNEPFTETTNNNIPNEHAMRFFSIMDQKWPLLQQALYFNQQGDKKSIQNVVNLYESDVCQNPVLASILSRQFDDMSILPNLPNLTLNPTTNLNSNLDSNQNYNLDFNLNLNGGTSADMNHSHHQINQEKGKRKEEEEKEEAEEAFGQNNHLSCHQTSTEDIVARNPVEELGFNSILRKETLFVKGGGIGRQISRSV